MKKNHVANFVGQAAASARQAIEQANARARYQTAMQAAAWYNATYTDTFADTNMDGALTREQLITMLWRYAGSPAAQGALAAYTDADSISDWALESMTWAVDLGLVKGNGESQLNPQGIATRAEVAALFARFAAWNNR